jgi:hypothetical protein
VETVVIVIIAAVCVVFAFVIGTLRSGRQDDARAGHLAAELEVERRRVGELQQEVDRLRSVETR